VSPAPPPSATPSRSPREPTRRTIGIHLRTRASPQRQFAVIDDPPIEISSTTTSTADALNASPAHRCVVSAGRTVM
jgi:hypothetical protein